MTSIQLLLLNLLYDILCLILPWDNVDEEQLRRPLEWSGRTLSRFMRVFGPVSSLFDLLTFAILFFILCPALCGGSFFTLGDEQKNVFHFSLPNRMVSRIHVDAGSHSAAASHQTPCVLSHSRRAPRPCGDRARHFGVHASPPSSGGPAAGIDRNASHILFVPRRNRHPVFIAPRH